MLSLRFGHWSVDGKMSLLILLIRVDGLGTLAWLSLFFSLIFFLRLSMEIPLYTSCLQDSPLIGALAYYLFGLSK